MTEIMGDRGRIRERNRNIRKESNRMDQKKEKRKERGWRERQRRTAGTEAEGRRGREKGRKEVKKFLIRETVKIQYENK